MIRAILLAVINASAWTRCRHCQNGELLRQRASTAEWVHDLKFGNVRAHTVCLSNELRNSKVAKWCRHV